MAYLRIVTGEQKGESIPLNSEKLVIGRNPECGLVIPASAVSREHAQVLRINNRFFLKDLKSRNKTFVNNQEVNPDVLHALNDQDKIKICDFLCTYVDEAPPGPTLPIENTEDHSSTVMSTVEAGRGSHLILESQPAERLKLIIQIANSLAGTLQIDALLPQIMENLFKIFKQADRGFIIVRDEATGRLMPKAIKTRREKDETTATFSKTIVNRCIDNEEAILSEDVPSDARFQMSQSISDFRIRSVMCAPLKPGDGKVFGVIQLDTQDRGKKFTNDDLQLLVAISSQAAVAMDNARLHEESIQRERIQREMEFAKDVQRGFLPQKLPNIPRYEFFAHYKAAREVGGDFYNFVHIPHQNRLVVGVGDVAGKGVPAALLMARLSGVVPSCVYSEEDLAKSVMSLNETLQQAGLADRFVTFLLASLDYVNHKLTIVNAGHLPPIIRRQDSDVLEEVAEGDLAGLPLGVMDNYAYRSCEVTLNPGDVVMLYTDGIPDALNPAEKQFLMDRVRATVQAARSSPTLLGKHVLNAVEQHCQGHPQYDDITLVCLGLKKDDA